MAKTIKRTIKRTFSLLIETDSRLVKIKELTHRGKGNIVDWLVEEAWDKLQNEKAGIPQLGAQPVQEAIQ